MCVNPQAFILFADFFLRRRLATRISIRGFIFNILSGSSFFFRSMLCSAKPCEKHHGLMTPALTACTGTI